MKNIEFDNAEIEILARALEERIIGIADLYAESRRRYISEKTAENTDDIDFWFESKREYCKKQMKAVKACFDKLDVNMKKHPAYSRWTEVLSEEDLK